VLLNGGASSDPGDMLSTQPRSSEANSIDGQTNSQGGQSGTHVSSQRHSVSAEHSTGAQSAGGGNEDTASAEDQEADPQAVADRKSVSPETVPGQSHVSRRQAGATMLQTPRSQATDLTHPVGRSDTHPDSSDTLPPDIQMADSAGRLHDLGAAAAYTAARSQPSTSSGMPNVQATDQAEQKGASAVPASNTQQAQSAGAQSATTAKAQAALPGAGDVKPDRQVTYQPPQSSGAQAPPSGAHQVRPVGQHLPVKTAAATHAQDLQPRTAGNRDNVQAEDAEQIRETARQGSQPAPTASKPLLAAAQASSHAAAPPFAVSSRPSTLTSLVPHSSPSQRSWTATAAQSISKGAVRLPQAASAGSGALRDSDSAANQAQGQNPSDDQPPQPVPLQFGKSVAAVTVAAAPANVNNTAASDGKHGRMPPAAKANKLVSASKHHAGRSSDTAEPKAAGLGKSSPAKARRKPVRRRSQADESANCIDLTSDEDAAAAPSSERQKGAFLGCPKPASPAFVKPEEQAQEFEGETSMEGRPVSSIHEASDAEAGTAVEAGTALDADNATDQVMDLCLQCMHCTLHHYSVLQLGTEQPASTS